MSDSVQPHRWQPTRLPHPWDSQGKNTGVGCHFLLQCMKAKSKSEVAQSCSTLSDPIDCSSPGSPSMGLSRQEHWSGMPLLPAVFFTELEQIIWQFVWKYKKNSNSQSNLEKEEWNRSNQPAWLQTILQSYRHQDSMVLAQRQKYRLMEQNRKPRDKSMHLWTPYLGQRRQEYTMEKRQSL